ncbi:MAG: potassium channel family protein [Thermoanaerobaculia bacterium]
MQRSRKRLLGLVAALPVLVLVAALVYMVGMAQLEDESRGFWQAIGWAAETLSTTGYGSDTTWSHPLMVVFVVVLQFIGVFLVFLIFPLFLIPFLEERFEVRLPKEVPPLEDHVVIYGFGAAVESLLAELGRAGLETVVVEADEGLARRMVEKGQRVVYGGLVDDALRRARLTTAGTLIANGTDDENAAVILAARQLGFEGDVLALVEDPFHRKPIMLAGATAAYTPRHILGAALAARASRRVSPTVAGAQQLSERLRVSEMRIARRSSLVGQTLAEAGIGQRTGVSVIAQWVGGELLTRPRGDMRLEANGILVLIGSDEAIARFGELCHATQPLRRAGSFLVAGAGEVGFKVAQLLRDAGEDVRVIDRDEGEMVDVVGDVLDPGVFERAGVAAAQAVILAVDTDSATLFSTVILKDLAPEVPVIARVNSAENVERIHRAGADFALSISQVSGQILARRLLGEEAVSVDPQLKVLKVRADGLVGHHPTELEIRTRTGCSVVAVERGEEALLEFGPDFRFDEDDAVYVCGSTAATRRYLQVFPQAPA